MARRKRATLRDQDALVRALATLVEAILDCGSKGRSMGECTPETPWGQCGGSLPDGTLIPPGEYEHALAKDARALIESLGAAGVRPSREIAQRILAERLEYLAKPYGEK